MTQLRSVTCHMGSHSVVTCYPTQVNTPRHPSLLSVCQCELLSADNMKKEKMAGKMSVGGIVRMEDVRGDMSRKKCRAAV